MLKILLPGQRHGARNHDSGCYSASQGISSSSTKRTRDATLSGHLKTNRALKLTDQHVFDLRDAYTIKVSTPMDKESKHLTISHIDQKEIR